LLFLTITPEFDEVEESVMPATVSAANQDTNGKVSETTKPDTLNKVKTLIFDIDLNKRSTDSPSSNASS
jgi:hypothetical protein